MTTYSIISFILFTPLIAAFAGCASYPIIDASTKKKIVERDKQIKKNLNYWQSQLAEDSSGGLVVTNDFSGRELLRVSYQGNSFFEAGEAIKAHDKNSICIWFWRENIPLMPEIYSCEFLKENISFKINTRQSLSNIELYIKKLKGIVSDLKEAKVDLEKQDTKLNDLISIIDREQIYTREIAESSTEYAKALAMLLEQIEKIASDQYKQLSDLAESRD